jgi:hypothetical protein
MAPLQKRALFGFIVGFILAIAILVLLIVGGGITRFDTDDGFRMIIDVLWVLGLIVPLVLFRPLMQNNTKYDERDRVIMERSIRIQWIAIVLSLAAWIIALSETYHAAGAVPVSFLYVMFISILIISTLSQSVGILIGYWSMNRHA